LPEAESAPSAAFEHTSVRASQPAVSPQSAMPASLEEWENECALHQQDLCLRPVEAPPASAVSVSSDATVPYSAEEPIMVAVSPSLLDPVELDKWDWRESVQNLPGSEQIESVEPDVPIPANLIEFPRELVATRKMRPRRAEGPFAAAKPEMQLSIFEVDPSAISTQPEPASVVLASWPDPAWAEIKLEPQARDEAELQPATPHSSLHLAPVTHRLRALAADGVLIACILTPVLMAAARISHPLPAKMIELGAVSLALIGGLLYEALFLNFAGSTPGMNWAGISLCTFDGQVPTREQLRSRLGGLLLSLVPVGLGIAWALFDDDRLCWHDRLSRTYPRMN